MRRVPPGSTRTDPLCPYTTRFLSFSSLPQSHGLAINNLASTRLARSLHACDISLLRKDLHMTQNDPGNDYPLSEVPMHARKGLASTAMVLLGFTFFTATMFAGGKLGVAFGFAEMLTVIVIGNLLLGLRSEEHTSELQSLMRISYAVFCL